MKLLFAKLLVRHIVQLPRRPGCHRRRPRPAGVGAWRRRRRPPARSPGA
jgi:hypothetical protein